MIKEILWILLGTIFGTITGLTPGIHANTIAFIALSLPFEKNLEMGLFIISMSITHSIVDSIPNILLGAPSEENFLSILPGHKLLLLGRGFEAIQLMVFGGICAGIFGILLIPVFYSLATNYSENLPIIIPAIIGGTLLLSVLEEKEKIFAAIIVILSGMLGIVALNSGIPNAVLVLVTGFFAFPSLIQAIFSKTKIPRQEKKAEQKGNIFFGFIASFASGITSILPGIGPSEAAFLIKNFVKKMSETEYLTVIGGINTGNLLFSILMLFAIEKTRTGMAAALSQTIEINWNVLLIFISTAIMSIGLAALITEKISWNAAKIIEKINYQKVSTIILVILAATLQYFSGIFGLLTAGIAATIALAGIGAKTKRSNFMAFLLIPTFCYYIGII